MKYLFTFLLIGGCTFGNGQICGPQTPIAYCDKEAYEKLAHPKPYGTRWIKDGASDEQRLVDIAECGGVGTHVGFTHEKIRAEKKTNDPDDFPAIFRLRATWEQCVALKGYHFE